MKISPTKFQVSEGHSTDERRQAFGTDGTKQGSLNTRLTEQTDAAHDLTNLADLVGRVGGVAVDLLAFGDLASGAHTDDLSRVVNDDLVDGLVEHVGASVDGAQAGETLGQLAQAVKRVEVRRLSVPGQRVAVELDLLERRAAGNLEVGVIAMQRQRVADEVVGVLVQTELSVDLRHGRRVGIDVLPGLGVVLVKVLNEDEEVFEATLLEEAHQV